MPARDRIEWHGVQIGCPDLVAGRRQRLDRGPEHGAIEALVLGMGEDDENFHGPDPRYFSMLAKVFAKVWTSPGHRAET